MSKCIICHKNEVTWPEVCDGCQDKEAQEILRGRLIVEGEEPDEWKCKSCGMLYDGGQCCTYCGDTDPMNTGDDDDGCLYDDDDGEPERFIDPNQTEMQL